MSITELRKAAVVILSLPRRQAADLFDQLDPSQMKSLTTELAKTRPITSAERIAVVREFAAAACRIPPSAPASRASPLASEAEPSTPFASLQDVDNQILGKLLAAEHPQTIALVLSHLPTARAAQIISRLSPATGSAVVRRLATIGPVSEDVRSDVELELTRRVVRFTRH
jgi:flagellar motor switch protein FliG